MSTTSISSSNIDGAHCVLSTIPFPVKLADFTAAAEGRTAHLRWSTTEEVNSDYFEVQHSSTGKAWTTLGSVRSSGESKALKTYSYNHAMPSAGINYYRLKMIDKDGSFEFSTIRSIEFRHQGTVAYPNPAQGTIYLMGVSPESVKSVRVYNATGVLVREEAGTAVAGGIRLQGLVAGIYQVKVEKADGTHTTARVVVEK